jgi:hypothetical protein
MSLPTAPSAQPARAPLAGGLPASVVTVAATTVKESSTVKAMCRSA